LPLLASQIDCSETKNLKLNGRETKNLKQKYEAERKILSAPRETKKWVRCFDYSAQKGSATGPVSLRSENFLKAKLAHPNPHQQTVFESASFKPLDPASNSYFYQNL
jgi:hypothetical protein